LSQVRARYRYDGHGPPDRHFICARENIHAPR
jgi:hypothetical protein